jgi:hypothetical protein
MSAMKKWFPSNFLAATDIKENQIVTIQGIKDEKVGREQEEKPVIYFDEYKKGVILNRTNAEAVAKAYGDGDPYKDWPGKKLKLFTEMTRNPQTRELAPAIRMVGAPKGKKEAAAEIATAIDDEIPFN